MKNNEKGQAIVELTISLVAIMVVFLGVIFAFALGDANVRGIINARGNCDAYAGNGQFAGDSGRHISDWSTGPDDRFLTNDDTAKVSGDDNPEYFTGELTTDEIDLTSGFGTGHVKYNFAEELYGVSSIFLTMADLTKDTQTTDPYEQELLGDLENAFRFLILDSDMQIVNYAYMPVFYQED
ncbi:MAG: hypothetical protein GXP32_03710 [Kiritimatiellaeota bacterium]|nr:hypothetical protein [Kiritimatiellota bacterium]